MNPLSTDPPEGWVVSAKWQPNVVPTLFKASWRVPERPSVIDDQIIFLFNGLEAPGRIIQCMLLWGSPGNYGNADGYSAVCMYAVDEQRPLNGPVVPIQPGAMLDAEIRLINRNGGQYTYTMIFVSHPASALTIISSVPMTTCCIALEAYQLRENAQYSSSNSVTFTNIGIRNEAGWLTPYFRPGEGENNLGESISIGDSRIAVNFRGQPLYV